MYNGNNERSFTSLTALQLSLFIILISECCWLASCDDGGKIVGGRFARAGEFPATVFFEGAERCGGTLVAFNRFLTAGRCFIGDDNKAVVAKNIKVIAGVVNLKAASSEKQESTLKEYKVHENFKKTPTDQAPHIIYDIAMGLLETPFIKSDFVQPAVFPAKDEQGMKKILDQVIVVNKSCQATGYGAANEDTLKVAKVHIIDSASCFLKEDTLEYEICTTTVDGDDRTGKGDVGSTFMCDGFTLGMVKGLYKITSKGNVFYYMTFTLFGPFMNYFKFGTDSGETCHSHPYVLFFAFYVSFHWS